MKRVVVISDLHCGHILGLTPPDWDSKAEETGAEYLAKAWKQRRHIWDYYAATIKKLQPIHTLIVNGDAIDGSGEGTGGREMKVPDKNEQANMAADCIKFARAKNVLMSFGTAYHTGKDVDFEKNIAEKVDAKKVESVGHARFNDVVFHYRHWISGSQVPHARHTAIARERLWNVLWDTRSEYPLADILIRSHVHYFTFSGDGTWLGMTTPCLQGYGGIYGSRYLSGLVDIGLLSFDIPDKGKDYTWRPHLCRMPRAQPVSL